LRVQNFPRHLNIKYNQIKNEISKLSGQEHALREQAAKSPLSNADRIKLRNLVANIEKLQTDQSDVRRQAELEKYKSSTVDWKVVQDLEKQKIDLENDNKILSKPLDHFYDKLRDKMAVLSIPYDVHRSFPSTGNPINEIKALKTVDKATAETEMKKYLHEWEVVMTKSQDPKYK